jgi:hypothetical protein
MDPARGRPDRKEESVFREGKRRQSSRRQPSVGEPNLLVHTIVTVLLLAAFAALAIGFLSAGPAPRSFMRDRHLQTQKHTVEAA